jgi:hypothetical protein
LLGLYFADHQAQKQKKEPHEIFTDNMAFSHGLGNEFVRQASNLRFLIAIQYERNR